MARIKILLVFFIAISYKTAAQEELQGKWYMFSRNRVIEINFSKDSLLTIQLNWDLSTRERNKPDTQLIYHVVRANGNIYLYARRLKDTSNQTLLNVFKIKRPDEQALMVLNGPAGLFKDTSSIRQYITYDDDKKYGLILYSRKEIARLTKQKNISEMTVKDFKTYADKLGKARAELDSLSKLPDIRNNLLYYGYSMIRDIFGELGYNPMATNDQFEEFIDKFKNNPETKSIVEKWLD